MSLTPEIALATWQHTTTTFLLRCYLYDSAACHLLILKVSFLPICRLTPH